MYEIDKQNVWYCLLHNVTDRHLRHFAQDAMKVSFAVHVMSSTVAAAIDTHVTAYREKCFLKVALCEQPCHVIQFSVRSHII